MLYCFIYDCARSTLYCLGKRSVFAVSTSPVTLSGSQSFTAIVANLESVSKFGWTAVNDWEPKTGLVDTAKMCPDPKQYSVLSIAQFK